MKDKLPDKGYGSNANVKGTRLPKGGAPRKSMK